MKSEASASSSARSIVIRCSYPRSIFLTLPSQLDAMLTHTLAIPETVFFTVLGNIFSLHKSLASTLHWRVLFLRSDYARCDPRFLILPLIEAQSKMVLQ